MAFELWSTASKNLLGDFATELEALAAVRAAVDAHGAAYADELLLARETSRGETRLLARGAVLCERAFAAVASPRLIQLVSPRGGGKGRGTVSASPRKRRRSPAAGTPVAAIATKTLREPVARTVSSAAARRSRRTESK